MSAPKTINRNELASDRAERIAKEKARKAANKAAGRTLSPIGEYRKRVQSGIEKAKKIVAAWDGGVCVHALFEMPGTEHKGTHMCHIIPQSKLVAVTEPYNGVWGCARFNREHYEGKYRMNLVPSGFDDFIQYIWLFGEKGFSRLIFADLTAIEWRQI